MNMQDVKKTGNPKGLIGWVSKIYTKVIKIVNYGG